MMKIIKRSITALLIISPMVCNGETVRANITSASDPALVSQRFQSSISPGVTEQEVLEQPKPSSEMAAFEKIHFTLNGVKFQGNTLYSDEELLKIFKDSLHKRISLADFQRMVDEITKKYRSEGYVLSRAILPPQVIKNGVVTIQVIEGFISSVKVEGDIGATRGLLEEFGCHYTNCRPFKISTLERDILLMNDMAGLTVKSVIKPSKTVPGGADLLLVAELQRIQPYFSYDNYGTAYIGPQQITAGASFNSLLPGDGNRVRYVTVPHNTELEYIEIVHSNPVNPSGLRFTLGGDYTQTHPLFILSPLNIVGRNQYVFADLSYPIERSRSENFFTHGSFNYQNVSSTILSGPFYNDLLRNIDLGISYDLADRWQGNNSVVADYYRGFDIWGAGPHVRQSRPLGVSDFTKFTLTASRLQWLNEKFSVFGGLSGQYAANPLLTAEQYSFGGPDYGRGYDPSEIVGDSAIAGKVEFRMNTAPEFCFLKAIQYYVFYDAGIVWNRDGVNLLPKQSATSTGIGARFVFLPQLTGNLFLAKPLTHNVATLNAVGKNPRLIRGFFSIVLSM